jgi:hypothetical protein
MTLKLKTLFDDDFLSFCATQEMLVNPTGQQFLLKYNASMTVSANMPAPYGESLSAINQWVDTYLTKSHPNLGRKGAVCPYVAHSVRINHLFVTGIRDNLYDFDTLCNFIRQTRLSFLQLPSASEKDKVYRSILVLFPDLSAQASNDLFIRLLEVLKTEFVELGLMLGEFHALPPEKVGLHNPNFKPLYSPVPLLAMRHMVKTDILFLEDNLAHKLMHQKYFSILSYRSSEK